MKYKNFNALIRLIETLRGENGCPWDQKQTPRSMMIYLIEEVYELLEAIESGDPDEVCEELGDVFFHILFIARLFQEKEAFDIEEVAQKITEKMIRRHPHVFGNDTVKNADEVRERWHKIKIEEKNNNSKPSVPNSVPVKLPAMMRAYRISERAARTNGDVDDISEIVQKIEEKWTELKVGLLDNKNSSENLQKRGEPDRLALSLGNLLFSLVNMARIRHIHPETALADAVRAFEKQHHITASDNNSSTL